MEALRGKAEPGKVKGVPTGQSKRKGAKGDVVMRLQLQGLCEKEASSSQALLFVARVPCSPHPDMAKGQSPACLHWLEGSVGGHLCPCR